MRRIVWEPWYDIEDTKEDEDKNDVEIESFQIGDDEDEEEMMLSSELISLDGGLLSKKINTPIGMFLENDRMLPNKYFESCWIGHANFDLTHKELNVLNVAPGVECVKVMSRYRFFIGVGKAFEFTSVRSYIENKLTDIRSEESEDPSNNRWALFLNENGGVDAISINQFDSLEEYELELARVRESKNGNVLVYNG